MKNLIAQRGKIIRVIGCLFHVFVYIKFIFFVYIKLYISSLCNYLDGIPDEDAPEDDVPEADESVLTISPLLAHWYSR